MLDEEKTPLIEEDKGEIEKTQDIQKGTPAPDDKESSQDGDEE